MKSDPIAFPFAIYLSTSLALHEIASVVGISSHFVIASLEGVVEDITSEEASRNILAGVH